MQIIASELLTWDRMAKRVTVIYSNSHGSGKIFMLTKLTSPPDAPLPGDEDGVPQPFIVVGDEAFALNKHLLRPFPGKSLTNERRIFNYRLSRARRFIECTFGILSNKWRVFHTPILTSPDFAVQITKAACILHNFVRRRDGYDKQDLENCNIGGIEERRGVGNAPSNAKDVREYFVKYVNSPQNALSWQNKVIL